MSPRKCKLSASMKTMVYTTSVALMVFFASLVEGNIEEDEVNCKPQHVHIAYGDSLVEMVVVWATLGPCSTELEFTTQPWTWDLGHRVTGNSSEFWEQNMNGLHYLHRVKLSGLQQTTTYYYRPLSNNIGSGPFYFKTPSTSVDWSPRLLVFGDLGVHSETVPSLVEEALRGEYTALIHAGDFAYNLKDSEGQVGDQFMELIEPVAAFLPYMTCPGNHEIDSDTFTHYNHRFSMPESPWPMSPEKMWYSFNVGPAHFISYSSEVFFTQGGAYVKKQFDWLVNDLRRANSNRDRRPWIIAFGHRPMYCSTNNQDDCARNDSLVRKGLEELFYGFGVDIILEAHEHNYERLYPMYGGKVLATSYVDPPAPIHIISGAAGSRHGVDPFQMPPKPLWSAVRVEEGVLNSYGELWVVNGSHVYWEQRSVVSHAVLDSLWIVQNDHRKFPLANLSSTSMSSQPSDDKLSDLFADEDPEARQRELKKNDVMRRIAIGVSFGILFTVLITAAVMSRACRKRRHYSTVRRWDASDLDYGKKLFSSAAPSSPSSSAIGITVSASKVRDDELDGDQDYEIDMGDMGAPSKKLLNNN